MERSGREGSDRIDASRMIFGDSEGGSPKGFGFRNERLRATDGSELVSLNDASDIMEVARFMRDYEGPGLDAETSIEAMKGLAALLHPHRQPTEGQRRAARDVLGSIVSGTLSSAAPELRPFALSLLKHFVEGDE